MKTENLDEQVLQKLQLCNKTKPSLSQWKTFLSNYKNPTQKITIALVGKYVELPDAYKSITEAFVHAGATNDCRVTVQYVQSETLTEENMDKKLSNNHGILVAPGFGKRGVEGKIRAVKYAREHNIPFFGICLGMQVAMIEFAQNVIKLENAGSAESMENPKHPIIDLMESQKDITDKGGTTRKGKYPCTLQKDSLVYEAYGKTDISERHRHRYEFNNQYRDVFKENGMIPVGLNTEHNLVEAMELKHHPYFVAVQFHPELKSTVLNPHPLFVKFIDASIQYKSKNN